MSTEAIARLAMVTEDGADPGETSMVLPDPAGHPLGLTEAANWG